jgi:hypothetical protein
MNSKQLKKALATIGITLALVVSCLTTPQASFGQTPFRNGTAGIVHLYNDKITSDGAVAEHQGGGYPAQVGGGPPAGQFTVDAGSYEGLPMYSFVNDHVKVEQLGEIEFSTRFDVNGDGTQDVVIKTTALYFLFMGNSLVNFFQGARIGTIVLTFADDSTLDSSTEPQLDLVAGVNIRNYVEGKLIPWIFSTTSNSIQNLWYGYPTNPNLGHAAVDILKISLPQAYHTKELKSITVRSTHGGSEVGGYTYRPGIRIMGITAPGFRPYPNGFWAYNEGNKPSDMRKLYPSQMIDHGGATSYEANYWQLFHKTYPDTIPAGIPLDANGHIDWTNKYVKVWQTMYGTYKDVSGAAGETGGTLSGGSCFGMAVESGSLYHQLPDIAWRPFDLQHVEHINQLVDYSPVVYEDVLINMARQWGAATAAKTKKDYAFWGKDQKNPLLRLADATKGLAAEIRTYIDSGDPFIMAVYWTINTGKGTKVVGHAVFPDYVIEDEADHKMYVYYYDNNLPDRDAGGDLNGDANQRVLTIDTTPGQEHFHAHFRKADPQVPSYEVDSTTDAWSWVFVQSIREIREQTRIDPDELGGPAATFSSIQASSLGPDSEISAVFGFTNSAGDTVGNLNGEWHSDIPEAFATTPLGWGNEPTRVQKYFLPPDAYSATITGVDAGAYRLDAAFQGSRLSFSTTNSSNTIDLLDTDTVGNRVSVTTQDASKPFTLEMNRYLDAGGSATWAYTIENGMITSGGSLVFQINDGTGGITITNNGSASASMDILFSQGAGADHGVPTPLGAFTVDAHSAIRVNSPDAPQVSSVNPVNGATEVSLTTPVSATFDRAMNQASVESGFSISPSVSGSFSWAGNTVTFTPSSALLPNTVYQVTLSDTATDAAGVPLSANYTWSFTTLEKKVSITPNGFDFQSVRLNTNSAAKGFTLSNEGTVNLSIASIGVTGGDGAMFGVSQGSCPSLSPVLGPGQGCEISVTFVPTSIGGKMTTLRIVSDATNQLVLDVILTGTGEAPLIDVPSDSYDFGKVLKGHSSTVQGITLTNNGGVALAVTSIGVAGADASMFQVTQGSCLSFSPTLSPGTGCDVEVVFAPDSKGDKTTVLSIVSDALNSPTTEIELNGRGVDFLVGPEEGTLGTEVTISGEAFGSKKGKVLIGDVALKVTSWSATLIKGAIGKAMAVDIPYAMTLQRKDPKGSPALEEEDSFTMRRPEIEKVEPDTGTSGGTDVIGITGGFFGTKKGKVYLKNGTVMKACKVMSWTETKIEFLVPKGQAAGGYDVTVVNQVDSGTANGAFTVN